MSKVTITIKDNKIVTNEKSPEYIILAKFDGEYKILGTYNNAQYIVDDLSKQLADIRAKREKK